MSFIGNPTAASKATETSANEKVVSIPVTGCDKEHGKAFVFGFGTEWLPSGESNLTPVLYENGRRLLRVADLDTVRHYGGGVFYIHHDPHVAPYVYFSASNYAEYPTNSASYELRLEPKNKYSHPNATMDLRTTIIPQGGKSFCMALPVDMFPRNGLVPVLYKYNVRMTPTNYETIRDNGGDNYFMPADPTKQPYIYFGSADNDPKAHADAYSLVMEPHYIMTATERNDLERAAALHASALGVDVKTFGDFAAADLKSMNDKIEHDKTGLFSSAAASFKSATVSSASTITGISNASSASIDSASVHTRLNPYRLKPWEFELEDLLKESFHGNDPIELRVRICYLINQFRINHKLNPKKDIKLDDDRALIQTMIEGYEERLFNKIAKGDDAPVASSTSVNPKPTHNGGGSVTTSTAVCVRPIHGGGVMITTASSTTVNSINGSVATVTTTTAHNKSKEEDTKISNEILVKQATEFSESVFSRFKCPLDMEFPKVPVRNLGYKQELDRYQLFNDGKNDSADPNAPIEPHGKLTQHIMTHKTCPVNAHIRLDEVITADGSLKPGTIKSAEMLLHLFALASEDWIKSIPVNYRKTAAEGGPKILTDGMIADLAEADSEIQKLWTNVAADKKAAAEQVYRTITTGSAATEAATLNAKIDPKSTKEQLEAATQAYKKVFSGPLLTANQACVAADLNAEEIRSLGFLIPAAIERNTRKAGKGMLTAFNSAAALTAAAPMTAAVPVPPSSTITITPMSDDNRDAFSFF